MENEIMIALSWVNHCVVTFDQNIAHEFISEILRVMHGDGTLDSLRQIAEWVDDTMGQGTKYVDLVNEFEVACSVDEKGI